MHLNLGFLSSHNGSSMRAIVKAIAEQRLDASARVVISNNAESPALVFAREHGIPALHLSATRCGGEVDCDKEIADALGNHGVDTVVLSGYMRKLGHETLNRFRGRILNIHPGPLPKFGGQGMYGKHVHEAVIGAGEASSGITIHLVDEHYDQGPIVAARDVPVEKGDSAEALAARVQALEPDFFVATLQQIAAGTLELPQS
jgi:phosphoribosylglycinamide formyltransferase-1